MRRTVRFRPMVSRARELFCLAALFLVLAAALTADLISPVEASAASHTLLAHLVHGARTVMVVGVLGVALALVAGGFLGALAARIGGFWDGVTSRTVEWVGTFPTIVMLALIHAMDPNPSLLTITLALALVRVPETARLVRILTLRLHSSEFVLAATALGASRPRVLIRHIGPHLAGAIAHSALLGVSLVVLLETSMTWVGLGFGSNVPSWGSAIAHALASGTPSRAILPIMITAATVAALLELAGTVRDRLDPRRFWAPPCAPYGGCANVSDHPSEAK